MIVYVLDRVYVDVCVTLYVLDSVYVDVCVRLRMMLDLIDFTA